MPGKDEIRDVILGAAEGATGSLDALQAAGASAAVEDFDVEVSMVGEAAVSAVVRFTIVVAPGAGVRRSVA